MVSYGGWVSVSGVIGPLLRVSDRMVIGATNGMAAVTSYTVSFDLVDRFSLIPASLRTALFPRLTMLSAEDARELAVRTQSALAAIMTPLVVAALLCLKPFLIWCMQIRQMEALVSFFAKFLELPQSE